MLKASNVELLNFYSLVKVPFKYAHKEVLSPFLIYILTVKLNHTLVSQFEDEELQTVLGYVVRKVWRGPLDL